MIDRILSLATDVRAAWRCAADFKSAIQLTTDLIAVRVLRDRATGPERRTIGVHPGLSITYRLNRGDLQAIREVILEECYTLPQKPSEGTVLLDLGANIGLTSLWLSKRFGFAKVISIEPDPQNFQLLSENLKANGIVCDLIEAAVGPKTNMVLFESSEHSVLGRLSPKGHATRCVDLNDLLRGVAIELVKIDIEGAEQDLFSGNTAWLRNVRSIVAELHPPLVDCGLIVSTLKAAGFRYVPTGTLGWSNMDFFIR